MEATTTQIAAPSEQPIRRTRWQQMSGHRLSIIARWLIALLLFVISPLISAGSIWPIATNGDPVFMAILGYAGFSLFTTIALFVPPIHVLLRGAFIVDVLFLALMVLLNNERNGIFFALYLLPLIGTAIQLRSRNSLFTGIGAACLYCIAYWVSLHTTDIVNLIDYVTLALRGLAIVFIPWFVSSLADHLSDSNRQKVDQAQLQSEDALRNAESYLDQMRALYEVAYTLSTTPNYQQVLDSALRESYKLVPYSFGMVLLSSGKVDELYVAATHPAAEHDLNRSVLISQGTISSVLRSANAIMVGDISKESELQQIASLRNCRAGCIIPLRAALRTYGVMLIANTQFVPFRREQLDMLVALANYAIIALHNAQLLIDLREERAKLISKEEEVRRQLARDLHDGPAQALAAITMNVEFIKRLLERDPSRVIDELDKLGALAKRTTHEVRTMLFELRPLVLETQGLQVTLEQYLERFQANSNGTSIVLDAHGAEDVSLDTKTEGTLFNIVQEAINNALKHAKAQHIWVRLKRDGNLLTTTVQDDGKGFDLNKVLQSYEKRGSFGLLNIDERARLVGGTAELNSAPGQGTTVRVIVPLE